MVMEQIMACMAEGGFDVIPCILGNGMMGIIGSRLLLGILFLLGATILMFRLKLPMELMAVFGVVFIGILVVSSGWIPDWIWYVVLIVVAFGVGFGIYKLGRR